MLLMILKILAVIWALPTSMVGLLILIPFGAGARIRWIQGALEVWGPGIQHMFKRLSPIGAQAMVLGHFVVGTSPAFLAAVRRHERVHVRQVECWGPFFLPAYLVASLWLFFRGMDWYRSNPFEVQAYSLGGDGDWRIKINEKENQGSPFWPWRLAASLLLLILAFALSIRWFSCMLPN